jgi:hypothetical protein
MKRSTLLTFVFCLYSNSAAFALPISLYEQLDDQAQAIYLGGVAEGILFKSVSYDLNGARPIFCIPDSVNLGGHMAKAALAAFKGDETYPVSLRVIRGLEAMFPCN